MYKKGRFSENFKVILSISLPVIIKIVHKRILNTSRLDQ